MHFAAFGKLMPYPITKTLLRMKLTAIFIFLFALQSIAETYAQVTIHEKSAPLEKVLQAIKKQSGYDLVYQKELVRLKSKPINVDLKDVDLKTALDSIFKDQDLDYEIVGTIITIKERKDKQLKKTTLSVSNEVLNLNSEEKRDLRGKVTDENGLPLSGVSLKIKGESKGTATNDFGEFILKDVTERTIVIISSIGYFSEEINIGKQAFLIVKLKIEVNELDEKMVIAYGTTTRRFNTGSVSRITSKEIERQPVSNPLATLQGRIPGLVVNSTSGLPGSSFTVQIRGQNSVNSTPPTPLLPIKLDQPLFIIDGVPFAPQNARINQFSSIASPVGAEVYNNPYGGISPFNSINPNDIESIEVLRDADATSIYGSRGANGVILITTKKGNVGKTKLGINISTGVSKVTRSMPLLNTSQYRSLRMEAFANDGIIPSSTLVASNSAYAPDLIYFDSLRNNNWADYFFGNSAQTTNINASLTGGNIGTQFLLGAGYHHETYIFPGDFGSRRYSLKTSIQHVSPDKKFSFNFSSSYSYDENNSSASANVLQAFTLPPNYPALLDNNGNLIWNYNGIQLSDNPLGYLKQKYSVKNTNLISNLVLGYKFSKNLSLTASFGYNTFSGIEQVQVPKSSLNPITNPQSRANFGSNNFQSLIVEPQIEYFKSFSQLKINVLVGTTYQQNTNNSSTIAASNYSNDALLGSASAAGVKLVNDGFSQYKYLASFGRINLNYAKKYIANFNGRRDGSSRFGPGKRFGNFGSLGFGWVFSEEGFIKRSLSFLTFGKLRTSYGITGDDGASDYQYIPRWGLSTSMTGLNFLGTEAYLPINLFNPDFSWSVTKKFEAGLELGILDNRILSNVIFYKNRSGNQLVSYRLATQAGGFDGVTDNYPALVENRGFEFEISTKNYVSKNFKWSSSFNLTIPKNELIAFPGIETSSYATTYKIGQPLSVLRKYRYTGINKQNGIYTFQDLDLNGTINAQDFQVIGNLDPKYYGGLNNTISFKRVELDFLLDFRKQMGPNYLAQIYSLYPAGSYGNLPTNFVNRWQKPGDLSELAKLTARRFASPAGASTLLFSRSSGAYSDASFIRLRSLSLNYSLDEKVCNKIKISSCKFYINCQNLITITKYQGNDPETKSFYSLPPLRTIVAGILVNL